MYNELLSSAACNGLNFSLVEKERGRMEWMVVCYVICIQSVPFPSEGDREGQGGKSCRGSVAKMAIDPNSCGQKLRREQHGFPWRQR